MGLINRWGPWGSGSWLHPLENEERERKVSVSALDS